MDRLGDVFGDPSGVQAFGPPLRHRRDRAQLVQILDGSPVALPHPGSSRHDDHGHAGGVRLGDPGQRVGQPRARRDAGRRGPPRGQGPPLGHEHRVLLVACVDEPKALPPGSLEQGEVVASGEGEQDLDARVQQRSRRERSTLVHGAGV